MKKLIPILIVGVLLISGLGAVAIASENRMQNKPMSEEDWELVIDIKGGFFGYSVRVTNEGNETVSGNLTIDITTDATIMLLGNELTETPDVIEALEPGEYISFTMRPVIGFGPALINIEGVFETPDVYPFETEANGFVLLFFVQCSVTPIVIP